MPSNPSAMLSDGLDQFYLGPVLNMAFEDPVKSCGPSLLTHNPPLWREGQTQTEQLNFVINFVTKRALNSLFTQSNVLTSF
jgi:hypothetical protein